MRGALRGKEDSEKVEIISVNGIPIGSLGYFGFYDLISDTSIEEYQVLVVTLTDDVEDVIILTALKYT